MSYNRLGQQDGKDPSEYSISIINLLDKVSALCRISEHILSSLISHHHAKILTGIKQKQMVERWGIGTYWIQNGPERMDMRWKRAELFSVLPYFGIPSTSPLQTSSLFVQLLTERG